MTLPATDVAFLEDRCIPYSMSTESGMICVLLPGFKLPSGCNVAASDLLLRLSRVAT